MIPLLPKWHLHGNRATFYDCDSVTMLELASTLHGKMNEVITEFNEMVESVNKSMNDFAEGEIKEREEFEVGLRQEFQDFIDTINLKIIEIDQTVARLEKNMVEQINEAIKAGSISVSESYDPATESLTIAVTGGVNNG